MKPRKIKDAQDYIVASEDRMNSLGIYDFDLQIKGKKFTHQVIVIDQLNNNISGIDYMCKHKLHYDVQTLQVKKAEINSDQILAIKEQVLPSLTSSVINMTYEGHIDKDAAYIYSILAPQTPTLKGMLPIVNVDKNSNYKITVNNCARCDIMIDRNDVIGNMDTESETLIPMGDSVISSILSNMKKTLPKL